MSCRNATTAASFALLMNALPETSVLTRISRCLGVAVVLALAPAPAEVSFRAIS